MSSYFWRNPLQQQILLGLLRGEYRPGKTCHILDVGCSSGEMLLTYAMLLADEYGDEWADRFAIVAIDHDAAKLEQFRRGIWEENRLYQMPPRYRDRYVREFDLPAGSGARARWAMFKSCHLINQITICEQDFDAYPAGGPESWDVILCQNTLLHLPPETARAWVDRIALMLRPDGLFVCAGHHGERADNPAAIEQLRRWFEPVPHNVVGVYESWLQRKHAASAAIQLADYDPADPDLAYRIGSIFRRRTKSEEA